LDQSLSMNWIPPWVFGSTHSMDSDLSTGWHYVQPLDNYMFFLKVPMK